MLVAFNEQKQKVIAFDTEKEDGPFFCINCNLPLILKKGDKKTHHFSHKANSECPHENESVDHMIIKTEIYKSLLLADNVSNCELEKSFGENRPDIYAEINGIPVAIEVQLSHLSVEKIEERTISYKNKGIYVLWITSYDRFLERVDLQNKIIAIKVWEKWLHTMYIGQIFLWKKGSMLVPVKLEPIKKDDGFNSKNKRTPISLSPIFIEKDLFPVKKEKWNNFPEALIFNNRKGYTNDYNNKKLSGLNIHGVEVEGTCVNLSWFVRLVNFIFGKGA
jgi:competence protein CoiA